MAKSTMIARSLPPHIRDRFAMMERLDQEHWKQTRDSRAAFGKPWYEIKDDDSLSHLGVPELHELLKEHNVTRDPSYLNKCAKIYVWALTGRLIEHDEFLKRHPDFKLRDTSEPYASMEIEAALRAEEDNLAAAPQRQPDDSGVDPIERRPPAYLDCDPMQKAPKVSIICGDSRTQVPELAHEGVDVLIGSPGYFGARDYDHPDQMGLEENESSYRAAIVSLLALARPKLKATGVVVLVVGDVRSPGPHPGQRTETLFSRQRSTPAKRISSDVPATWPMRIPQKLFEDLIADGWWPIQSITWHKPRHAPEGRVRRVHSASEMILILAKGPDYHWNEGVGTPVMARRSPRSHQRERGSDPSDTLMKFYTDVWSIQVCRNKTLTHPARYPEELVRRALRLWCPAGGHVLDLWGGSGTTAVAASQLGMNCTLIELNSDYVAEARARLATIPGAQKWRKPLIVPEGKLNHGDALTELWKVAIGSIDLAVFDPSYGNGATGLEWDRELDWELIFEQLWRVLKIDGFIAVCCNARLLAKLITMQPGTFRYAIHWFRRSHANFMQRDSQPKRHIEYVVIFGRVARRNYSPQTTPTDKATFRSRARTTPLSALYGKNVVTTGEGEATYDAELPRDLRAYEYEPGEKIRFPTQKPIAMGLDLIKTLSRPGDTILDICTGSATFPIAAMRCGRQFIAIEKDEKHFGIACDRLAAEQATTKADQAAD